MRVLVIHEEGLLIVVPSNLLPNDQLRGEVPDDLGALVGKPVLLSVQVGEGALSELGLQLVGFLLLVLEDAYLLEFKVELD